MFLNARDSSVKKCRLLLETRRVALVILLFGPPGCGKGTQSPLLRERLGIPAISTGEMLRREIHLGTEIGREADILLSQGKLMPTAVVKGMLEKRLEEADCQEGFLIDGYPRTVEQSVHLAELLERLGHPKPMLVHMDVPNAVLVGRLSARWTCPECASVYNLQTKPPQAPGKCDHEGAALIQRRDDTMETAYRRLEAYEQVTNPVLEFFGATKSGTVVHINGHQEPDLVFEEIRQNLEEQHLLPVGVLKRT